MEEREMRNRLAVPTFPFTWFTYGGGTDARMVAEASDLRV